MENGFKVSADRLVRWLSTDSKKAFQLAAGLLAVLALELAVAIAATGCPRINAMAWDVATMLDGGWRLLAGQRPHVDFYSPMGLLPLALVAAGMRIGTPSPATYGYVHALMLPLLTFWAFWLLRSRTSAIYTLVLALWVGVLAVAPRSLGWSPPHLTYSMQYNRWGWALLLIAAIELFVPKARPGGRDWGAFSTGVIAGLLLFLKINYFSAIAGAIVIRLVVFGLDWKWILRCAAAFGAVAVAGFWYLRLDFGAFLADVRLLGSVQKPFDTVMVGVKLVLANVPALWWLVSVLGIAILVLPKGGGPTPWLRFPGIALAAAALGVVLCSANYQNFEIPLITFAGFLAVEELRRANGKTEPAKLAFLAVSLITLGTIAGPLYHDLYTLAGAKASMVATAWEPWPEFEAARLRPMEIAGPRNTLTPESVHAALRARAITWREESEEAYPYVMYVNDGTRLLERHRRADMHVVTLDLSNPFSFALGLVPPRGDALFWHYERSFDSTHFPAAARVFREVTHVMRPKSPIHRLAAAALGRIYHSVLESDFRVLDESDLWVLYERKPDR